LPKYGVAGKYALALYITTVRKNALELVEAELQQVCGVAETNLVFADFHKDPSVLKTVRVKAIVEIFKNIKFNDVMKNFLGMGLYLYCTNHFFLLSASANILGCIFHVQGKVSYS
jgi:F-type H+-transporting ATPase subunit O